jgi:hypothetical protein
MDTAILIVHTSLFLLLGAFNFALIGKQPESLDRRSGTAITAFLYGMFTIAFVIWWDTPDTASMLAKYGIIAFMWLPWLLDLPNINKPYSTFKTWQAVVGAALIGARIGVVLAFWH